MVATPPISSVYSMNLTVLTAIRAHVSEGKGPMSYVENGHSGLSIAEAQNAIQQAIGEEFHFRNGWNHGDMRKRVSTLKSAGFSGETISKITGLKPDLLICLYYNEMTETKFSLKIKSAFEKAAEGYSWNNVRLSCDEEEYQKREYVDNLHPLHPYKSLWKKLKS